MPETHTTRGADKRCMVLINDVERMERALRAEIALVGRTSVTEQRAEVSGPCGNHKLTCKLGSCVKASRDAAQHATPTAGA